MNDKIEQYKHRRMEEEMQSKPVDLTRAADVSKDPKLKKSIDKTNTDSIKPPSLEQEL